MQANSGEPRLETLLHLFGGLGQQPQVTPGGGRAAWGVVRTESRRLRCARVLSITTGSSMLVLIFNVPPLPRQLHDGSAPIRSGV